MALIDGVGVLGLHHIQVSSQGLEVFAELLIRDNAL